MKHSQAQQLRREFDKRVAESRQRPRPSFTVGSLLILGPIFIVSGIYGAVKAWEIIHAGNPTQIIGRDARGLNATVTDHFVRCAGIAVIGVAMVWVGIRKKRGQERNSDEKTSS